MQFPLHRDSAAIQFVFFQCKQGHRRNFGWKSIVSFLNYLTLNEIYVNWPVLSMLLWLIQFFLSNYESFQGNLSFSWAQLKTNISFPEKCNGCMFVDLNLGIELQTHKFTNEVFMFCFIPRTSWWNRMRIAPWAKWIHWVQCAKVLSEFFEHWPICSSIKFRECSMRTKVNTMNAIHMHPIRRKDECEM